MKPWKKKTIKQNFANAIMSLEHTIHELDSVITKEHLGSMQTVVDEYYQHLTDLLREEE
jgi:hypothetical protein